MAFGVCKKCYARAIFTEADPADHCGVMSVEYRHIHKCPTCGSSDLVKISLTLEGSWIEFRACHACEERWWEKDGLRVPLKAVLDLVPKR
jgi:hypothetical protein